MKLGWREEENTIEAIHVSLFRGCNVLTQVPVMYTPTQWSVIVLCPVDDACFFVV